MIKQPSLDLTRVFVEELVNLFPTAAQPIRPRSASDAKILEGLLQGFAALCRTVETPANPMSLLAASMRSAFVPPTQKLNASQIVLARYAEMVLDHMTDSGYHLDIVPRHAPVNPPSMQRDHTGRSSSIQIVPISMGQMMDDEIHSMTELISRLEIMEDEKLRTLRPHAQGITAVSLNRLLR